MIPHTIIKAILEQHSSDLGIPFIRADQKASPTEYPFLSYKVISSNEESAHQDIKEYTENKINPTLVDFKTFIKNTEIISLTFIDKNKVDELDALLNASLEWFRSIAGREFIKAQGVTAQLINNTPNDRSIWQEAYWENRIGYDIRFDYTREYMQIIEGAGTIIITPTIEGVVQDDIIITP